MMRRKNPSKANGHAGLHDRRHASGSPEKIGANGHAPAATDRGGIPGHLDRSASDGVCGASAAIAAACVAAGADREACVEAAPPRPNGAASGSAVDKPAGKSELQKIPPGEGPLPATPSEFVEEIHRRADLFEVWQGLLNFEDIKIKQRAVEKLTEMRYKGVAALEEEPQQIVFDMPRPKRD